VVSGGANLRVKWKTAGMPDEVLKAALAKGKGN